MGLGTEAVYHLNIQREMPVLRLILVVGRAWAALDLYHEVVQHFAIEGTWEICLAIPNTGGSRLDNLGEGRAGPAEYFCDLPPCDEPGVPLRREVGQFLDTGGTQSLAFSYGAWLEAAWSMRERRCLAYRGQLAGQFDKSRYSWR